MIQCILVTRQHTHMKPNQLVITAIIALATGSSALAFEKREVRLENTPAAVQSTIAANTGNGKLDEVDRVSFDGKTFYIAEIDMPGDNDIDLYISEDGTLTRSVQEIPRKDVPEAVTRAAEAAANGGKIDDIDKETAGETVTYHVEIDRPGPDLKLVISPDGNVVSSTEEMDD